MIITNLDKKRIWNKTYRLGHKQKCKELVDKWRKNHQEEIKSQQLIYRNNNKEKINDKYKDYRMNNLEKINSRDQEGSRIRRLKRRQLIFDHYGWKCVCCGETMPEFLTIDHINGGGTKQRKETGGGGEFYRWLIKNNYPDGFQTLCMNCNHAKGHYGKCPHQNKSPAA